ncbi:hypothetical protein AB1K91_08200 [Terribacillus sp. 179-K 1B1 HS]|uniref:hypothetical protein n=1 Tax=Terribacillus sp. 179-K 1B1 HS TaxID=3142388 RepID=UPI0039A01DB0
MEYALYYSDFEVAEILGVPDQTIRSWCEKGRYSDVIRSEKGEGRIPKKYFRITLEQARKRNTFEKELDRFNSNSLISNEDDNDRMN